MNLITPLIIFVVFFIIIIITIPHPANSARVHRGSSHHPCDSKHQQDPRLLRSDQLTVLINGYSESRIPLLQSISATYASSPVVSSVLILWGNPYTSLDTLSQFANNLSSSSSTPISIIRQQSSSLNARFLPRASIRTRAVLICDDDVEVDHKTLDFAFTIWRSNPDRLIGLFARSHGLDISKREWIYTVHQDKYSIVLTKFMILSLEYLFRYSCGAGSMVDARSVVDKMVNCEDVLMNFVVADVVNVGPILVGVVEGVRDYGDARNDDDKDGRLGLKEVGLSSGKRGGGEHRKRRGECIREFHSVFGRMPLRYSYGKVVSSVGEQGLCKKGGKLVFCDEW